MIRKVVNTEPGTEENACYLADIIINHLIRANIICFVLFLIAMGKKFWAECHSYLNL